MSAAAALAAACPARPGPRDGRRHRGEHEDPAERQLGQRGARRDELTKLLHEGQAGLVVESGEGLADVERLAVAVEVAMVLDLEGRVAPELAREQPGGQGHARQHAHVARRGLGQEVLRGPLTDEVEDDLDAGDARELDGLPGLLDLLHADPVVRDDAVGDELVEGFEELRAVVDLGRWAVQLHEVDALDLEVLAAARQPAREGLGRVVGDQLLHAPAHLGGHEDALTGPLAQELRDEPLAVAVSVDIGRVDEVDASVHRGMQGCQRLAVIQPAPAAPDGPGPEADGAHLVAGPAQSSVLHDTPL